MLSKWSDEDAQAYIAQFHEYNEDLALRVYTTRLLGKDPALVLHGGGNTSVKTRETDELGRTVSVLRVKGSGWDMGNIEPEGLPAVLLDGVKDFRQLSAMTDEAMVNGVRRHLLDTTSPNPSVETLLHGFLPHKFIDHTHADAVLAIADQPDAAQICRVVFGDRMGIVPYIMPGFDLSKEATRIYEENPHVDGLILINHGIFTFGETAKEAYERMIHYVTLAEEHIGPAHKPVMFLSHSSPLPRADHAQNLAVLRGCLQAQEQGPGPQILEWRRSQQIQSFLSLPDWADLATRGPATPDHIIRTKQKPLIIEEPSLDEPGAFRRQIEIALATFTEQYKLYFRTQAVAKSVEKKQLHPLPVVFLIPGLGLITVGKTVKEARVAADIYEHTIDVITKAEMVGSYHPLPDHHLFDMEYWSLEQAKLGKKKPAALAGKVVLITGACGGIGQATARKFAQQGANLLLTDLKESDLHGLAGELVSHYGVGVVYLAGDITDPQFSQTLTLKACTCFGGLDAVVSNAGSAVSGPIAEGTGQLETSLQINLMSHQHLASAATRIMTLQQVGGCLLFNASKSAFNPGSGFGAYAIAKAGLVALMKQYAVEFAAHGIRSLAINADRVRTNLFDPELLASRARARGLSPDSYFRANMLGLEVLANDVADAFLRLFLSEKSTGMVMTVDGGNIAASPR